MATVITIRCSAFDDASEPPGINDIKGHAFGSWCLERLRKKSLAFGELQAEDWGWYAETELDGRSYLVGFCTLPESDNNRSENIVQIHLKRSIFDRLAGKNRLDSRDRLTLELIAVTGELVTEDGVEIDYDA